MTGKVCVIGAGAAGLCAARHLLSSTRFTPVVFEQSAVVGGTWVYTDERGRDSKNGLPIHSSMYKNLGRNSPRLFSVLVIYKLIEMYKYYGWKAFANGSMKLKFFIYALIIFFFALQ
jgi:cation diffusion facilitator CzcD-associated flavoprotein CzcO